MKPTFIRFILLALGLLFLAACRSPGVDMIIGEYALDTDAYQQVLDVRRDKSYVHTVLRKSDNVRSQMTGAWSIDREAGIERIYLHDFSLVMSSSSFEKHQSGEVISDFAAPAISNPLLGKIRMIFDPDKNVHFIKK